MKIMLDKMKIECYNRIVGKPTHKHIHINTYTYT